MFIEFPAPAERHLACFAPPELGQHGVQLLYIGRSDGAKGKDQISSICSAIRLRRGEIFSQPVRNETTQTNSSHNIACSFDALDCEAEAPIFQWLPIIVARQKSLL